MNPTGLRKNSPLKAFSFSQRDTILTGKAVCLSKKPTAKSTKGQKQISAILEKRKLNLPLGSKSHTEIVSIFFSLDPHSMETINALRKASPVTGQRLELWTQEHLPMTPCVITHKYLCLRSPLENPLTCLFGEVSSEGTCIYRCSSNQTLYM